MRPDFRGREDDGASLPSGEGTEEEERIRGWRRFNMVLQERYSSELLVSHIIVHPTE